jgi:protein SCO1/2
MQELRGIFLAAAGAAALLCGQSILAEDTREAGNSDTADDRVQIVAAPQSLRDFALVDQASQPFGASDLRGRTSLVFFGFTSCQSVCPPTMEKLRQVAKALADEPGPLASVLISVDGERDTPAALEAYLAPFQPNFIGVTGPPQVVRDVATDFSAVFFKGMPTDTKGGYDVEHTSQVYLVDRDARLRATFYNAPTDAMVALVRQVMHEK